MESDWLQSLLTWVEAHPHATGWLVFLVAWAESLLLVGIILPGAAILIGLGTLIGFGVLDFKVAWIAATLGAFAGDGLSFWIGYHYKQKLLKMWPMYKFPKQIEQGQTFFAKWGSLSVFIGRFVGLVRPVIPAIAGVMDMPVKKYIIISAVAAILWSPFYLLPGMLFGSAMGSMTQVAGKLALLVSIIIVAVVFTYWLIHIIYQLLLPRTHKLLSKALLWTQRHPHLGRFTSGLIDPRKPETGSLGLIAVSIIVLTVAAIVFLINTSTVFGWSETIHSFILAFHSDWTQPFMLVFLSMAHDLSILLPSIAVFVWLVYRKRHVAAWHWAFVVLSSLVLSVVIEMISQSQFKIQVGYHHLAWFVAVLTFWAALISGALPHRMRSWPYSLSTVLVVLVAFAQMFFYQMSLGVVLVSVFSAFIWASVVAIAYRMRIRRQFLGWHVSMIFHVLMISVVIVAMVFFRPSFTHEHDKNANLLSYEQWTHAVEEERTDWLNRSMQSFNLKFRGDLEPLKSVMQDKGWQVQQPKAWSSVWQALKADENTEDLPLIPKMNEGQVEKVIFTLVQEDRLLSLHLWQQKQKLNTAPEELYQGYLSLNSRASEWGLNFWQFNKLVEFDTQWLGELKSQGFAVRLIDGVLFLEGAK